MDYLNDLTGPAASKLDRYLYVAGPFIPSWKLIYRVTTQM